MSKYPVWEQFTVQANKTINTSQPSTVFNWIHITLYLYVLCVKLNDYIVFECIQVSWVSFWCSICEHLSNYMTLSAVSWRDNCKIQDILSEMSDIEPVCWNWQAWDLLLKLSDLAKVARIVRSGLCCYNCQVWNLLSEWSHLGHAVRNF